MIYPSADRLTEQVDSRYTLVVLAARRAKQLREGAGKLIETPSTNALTIALEEIAAGKVTFDVPCHDDVTTDVDEQEMVGLPEIETPQEEAAEIISEPKDESDRVAELLQIPSSEGEEETSQPEKQEAAASADEDVKADKKDASVEESENKEPEG